MIQGSRQIYHHLGLASCLKSINDLREFILLRRSVDPEPDPPDLDASFCTKTWNNSIRNGKSMEMPFISFIFKVPLDSLSFFFKITVTGKVGSCLLEPLQVCYLRVFFFLRLLAMSEPPKGVHNTQLHGYDRERHVCNLGSQVAYTPVLL